jgi:hypothetical protein
MPQILPILEIDAATPDVLAHKLDGLRAWQHLTHSQADAVLQTLLPLLPCDVSIAMRSPGSIVYVTASTTRFRIARQGKLNPKPWNSQPRLALRNPWLD